MDHIIETQIKNAPKEIRTLLANGEWQTFVQNIAQASGFSEDQRVVLENEVLFVLIGLDLRTNFTKNIQENLDLTSITAGGISLEIENGIFSKVRDLLPTEVETEPETNPERELPAPKDLIPSNLPTETTLEQKINPLVGSPNEKTSWEERKQQVQKDTIMADRYKGADPYREPIK